MKHLRAISTHYAGRFYRSRTEARWAIFFDCCGIPFQYEHEGFALPSGAYLPDFWLPTFQMFLEVKGEDPTDEERTKCVELAELSERVVLLAMGAPEERFQIIWFDANGEHEDVLYAIARDRRAESGFWLVSEDLSRWMGGGDITGKLPRQGPLFSGALEQAYATALSERFVKGRRDRRYEVIPEIQREFGIDPAPPVAVRGAA